MGTIKYNLTGLNNIYWEAMNTPEKAFSFDITNGKGRFLFMMFLSDEDKEAKDKLYIFMRNTNVLRTFKLYGSHKNGDFYIYIDGVEKKYFLDELELGSSGREFDFSRFLDEINDKIPVDLDRTKSINNLRENKELTKDKVDESEKTVFIGVKRLSGRKPRDKTLRKMYLYLDADHEKISKFIDDLKSKNMTVAWTTEDKRDMAADINEFID